MKIPTRQMTALIASILMIALLAGCGGPSVSPEESVKIYGQMVANSDFSNAEKIKIPQETQEKLKNESNSAAKGFLQIFSSAFQIQLTEDQLNRIMAAGDKLRKKIEVQTELVSKTDGAATVKVSVTPMDMNAYMASVQPILKQKIQGMQPEQIKEKIGDIVADAVAEAYDRTGILPEKITFETECVVDEKTNAWRPKDEMQFVLNLSRAIVNQENNMQK